MDLRCSFRRTQSVIITSGERKNMKFAARLALCIVLALPATTHLAAQTHDPGYPEERTWLDVNGDRIPDYCRVVGNPGHFQIACAISRAAANTVAYTSLYSPPGSPIDRGYPSSGGFVSPSAGIIMYCAGVGNSPNAYLLSCSRFFIPSVITASAAGSGALPLAPVE